LTGEQTYELTRQLAAELGIKLPMFYELAANEQVAWDELAHENLQADKTLTSKIESGTLQP
jgi:hypothetical protein